MKYYENIVNDILGKNRLKDNIDTQSFVQATKNKYPTLPLSIIALKVNVLGKYGTMQNQSRKLTSKDVQSYLTVPGYEHDRGVKNESS